MTEDAPRTPTVGDLVELTAPSLFVTAPVLGTVVDVTSDRVMVQVGQEKRPRPVRFEHLTVVGRSDLSLDEIQKIWDESLAAHKKRVDAKLKELHAQSKVKTDEQ